MCLSSKPIRQTNTLVIVIKFYNLFLEVRANFYILKNAAPKTPISAQHNDILAIFETCYIFFIVVQLNMPRCTVICENV